MAKATVANLNKGIFMRARQGPSYLRCTYLWWMWGVWMSQLDSKTFIFGNQSIDFRLQWTWFLDSFCRKDIVHIKIKSSDVRCLLDLHKMLPCTKCCSDAISSCALRSCFCMSVSRLYSARTTWLFVSFNSFPRSTNCSFNFEHSAKNLNRNSIINTFHRFFSQIESENWVQFTFLLQKQLFELGSLSIKFVPYGFDFSFKGRTFLQ